MKLILMMKINTNVEVFLSGLLDGYVHVKQVNVVVRHLLCLVHGIRRT